MPATPHHPGAPAIPSVLLAPALLLLALALSGCDKCGNRVNINVPGLQHSCGDNVQPAR